MSGCSFDVTCFTIHGVLDRSVSSGMLVASALAPWGTIEPYRGTSDHKKEDLGGQTWISIDLGWSLGPHFEGLGQHVFFVMRLYRSLFFMMLGSALGFGDKIVAKINLPHILGFC